MIDVKKTQEWWKSVLSDEVKLEAFLRKLEHTEYSGYDEHMLFIANNRLTDRQFKILDQIALDELKHSEALIAVMSGRGMVWKPYEGKVSVYWETVLQDCTSYTDYCAANYYGEALACERFKIMLDMPETPEDIKDFLRLALPDETFHRITLKNEAGEVALARLKILDERAKKLVLGY